MKLQNTLPPFQMVKLFMALVLLSKTCTNLVELSEVLKAWMGYYSDCWKAQNKGSSPAEFFLKNIGSLFEIFDIWLPYRWLPVETCQTLLQTIKKVPASFDR